MILIGDSHGKVEEYFAILKAHPTHDSIQVGDFGFKEQHDWFLNNVDFINHKINMGNHDYIPYVNKMHSLGDFSYNKTTGIMTVRGAKSIDRGMEAEGIDYFKDEELNYGRMQEAIDYYCEKKPSIMVTHDCPKEVCKQMFGIEENSMTKQGLQAMFEIHQPKLWVFGHHHKSRRETINGTQFICLAELESIII